MTSPEPTSPDALAPPVPQRRPLREIVIYFLRLGTLGFGGPVALVGLMEKELVQDRQWLTREEMRNAVAVSQSLPGPLAIQVGIFIAYLRGGFWAPGPGVGPLSCRTSLSLLHLARFTSISVGCRG